MPDRVRWQVDDSQTARDEIFDLGTSELEECGTKKRQGDLKREREKQGSVKQPRFPQVDHKHNVSLTIICIG